MSIYVPFMYMCISNFNSISTQQPDKKLLLGSKKKDLEGHFLLPLVMHVVYNFCVMMTS